MPSTLSARARLLDSGRTDKTDPHDARSAAVVALRHDTLQAVRPVDHAMVLRLLLDRRRDLTRLRTQAVCRLHALLSLLRPGGLAQQLSADKAAAALRSIRPADPVAAERKRMALELLSDVRHLDQQLAAIAQRITDAVTTSGTTVTDVFGIGPILAAVR